MIIPAATVSFVPASMSTKLPVLRFFAYESNMSGAGFEGGDGRKVGECWAYTAPASNAQVAATSLKHKRCAVAVGLEN